MPTILQFRGRVTQLIEERMRHRFNRAQTLRRRVLEQLRDKVDCRVVGLAEYLEHVSSVTAMTAACIAHL